MHHILFQLYIDLITNNLLHCCGNVRYLLRILWVAYFLRGWFTVLAVDFKFHISYRTTVGTAVVYA